MTPKGSTGALQVFPLSRSDEVGVMQSSARSRQITDPNKEEKGPTCPETCPSHPHRPHLVLTQR